MVYNIHFSTVTFSEFSICNRSAFQKRTHCQLLLLPRSGGGGGGGGDPRPPAHADFISQTAFVKIRECTHAKGEYFRKGGGA